MKNEKLLKQIKELQKHLPKEIILKPEGLDRELTKDEIQVIRSYFIFYRVVNFKPKAGLLLPKISCKSYLDFAFMDDPFKEDGKLYIYLNLR
jgi:hypothetical protein